MKKIFFLEIVSLKRYIFIYVSVLILMYSVIVSVTSFSYTTTSMITDEINDLSSDMNFEFVFSDIKESELEELRKIGFSDIRREYVAKSIFNNPVLRKNDLECKLSGNFIISYDGKIYDSSGKSYHITVINGKEIQQMDCSGIWISESIANELKVDIDDYVNFGTDNTNKTRSIQIIGIFNDKNNFCNFVMSADIIDEMVNESQYTKRNTVTAILPDYSSCDKVMSSAEMKKYNGYCYLYDYIYQQTSNTVMTCNCLKVLCVILSISVMFVLTAFINTVIYKRMQYIGMLKSLGLTSINVIGVYWLIIAMIIFLSVTLSCPISICMNRYITKEFNSIFSIINLELRYNVVSLPVVFVLANIFILPGVFYMYEKIKSISAVTILKENE